MVIEEFQSNTTMHKVGGPMCKIYVRTTIICTGYPKKELSNFVDHEIHCPKILTKSYL